MQPISTIVKVTVIRGVRTITRAGFGTPLVLTDSTPFQGIREYLSTDEVADDFASSSNTYKMALRLFSAEVKPDKIKVMARSAVEAMVQTLTPNVATQEVTAYTVTINGVPFTFTSDVTPTAVEVVTGLIAAINAGTEPVTASGTNTLVLTADQPGIGFSLSTSPKITAVVTNPGNGIVDDLNEAKDLDLDWYGLAIVSRDSNEAYAAAEWIETQRKIFVFSSSEEEVLDAQSTDDIAARLKAANFTRTVFLFSKSADIFPEGSWLSDELPRDPGSYTMKFKTLIGVPADDLRGSEITAVKGKNGNVFTKVGSVDIVAEGKVAFGEFVDVIRFIDWLQAQIEEGVFARLVSNPKIPFTDKGIGVIEGEVRFALDAGVDIGGLSEDKPYIVTVPKSINIGTPDKAARTLKGVKFSADLAGAIHFTEIDGTVGV